MLGHVGSQRQHRSRPSCMYSTPYRTCSRALAASRLVAIHRNPRSNARVPGYKEEPTGFAEVIGGSAWFSLSVPAVCSAANHDWLSSAMGPLSQFVLHLIGGYCAVPGCSGLKPSRTSTALGVNWDGIHGGRKAHMKSLSLWPKWVFRRAVLIVASSRLQWLGRWAVGGPKMSGSGVWLVSWWALPGRA